MTKNLNLKSSNFFGGLAWHDKCLDLVTKLLHTIQVLFTEISLQQRGKSWVLGVRVWIWGSWGFWRKGSGSGSWVWVRGRMSGEALGVESWGITGTTVGMETGAAYCNICSCCICCWWYCCNIVNCFGGGWVKSLSGTGIAVVEIGGETIGIDERWGEATRICRSGG